MILHVSIYAGLLKPQRATIFGASGGVGQLICKKLLNDGYNVRAITRDIKSASSFEFLNGCEFVQADARQKATLPPTVQDSDVVIISVGTTAFPTKKWDNGNNPKAACVDTVNNVCKVISESSASSVKTIILLSSIGVERADKVYHQLYYSLQHFLYHYAYLIYAC